MFKPFLNITKALSDETRVRALLALREGELCLCQIIEMLGMAPSTVSKHMDLLSRPDWSNDESKANGTIFVLQDANPPPSCSRRFVGH
ncbi:MAG: hypothetical protein KatS3mg104_2882 [Phycisphaerae bacterium]|jgi:DNA-binding transcriptional ArsR family regulator|nr:MAG: hypothetical protein KatS3mg104_2882 [Phycisphaerae bacterium]